jgi:hypothetical protein
MDFKWVGWLGTIYVVLTLICRTIESTFFTSADLVALQNIGVTQTMTFGWFSLPAPSLNIFDGLMRILDFSEYNQVIFTGNAMIIYYILAGASFMVAVFLAITLISIAVNAIRGVL